MSQWKKARKIAIAEFREATPEDEEMIRRLEPEAIEALGLEPLVPLWPHYLIMRGSEGEIYPQARFIFEKNYEVVEEHGEREEMRLGWAE